MLKKLLILSVIILSFITLTKGQTNLLDPDAVNFYSTIQPEDLMTIEAIGEDALVYVDYAHFNDGVVDALTNLGFSVTLASGWLDFNTKLATGDYELAVAFKQNYAGPNINIPTVTSFIASGGKMVYATWRNFNPPTEDVAEAALFEAAFSGSNNQTTVTIIDPALAAGLTNPFTLSNAGWTQSFSRPLTPIGGGEVLATFENDDAAIIRGNNGQTIMLGYLSDAPPAAMNQQLLENIFNALSVCPEDITVDNDPGLCGAIVEYDTPLGTLIQGSASGSFFPVGETIIEFSNPSCTFKITVEDNEPPVPICYKKSTGKAAYVRSAASRPWGETTNEQAMDAVFGAGNWTESYYETADPGVLLSTDYDFIFMEGGSSTANEMEAFVDANIAAMEAWVYAGGHLFLNAAPNEGDGMDWGFGGVTLEYSGSLHYITSVVAADNQHPIFNGPFTPVTTAYTGNYFAHAIVPDYLNQRVLIRATSDPEKHVLTSVSWGSGLVFFGGMTTVGWHQPQPEAYNLRANMISYLGNTKTLEFFLDDYGMASVSLDDIDAGSWDNCGLQSISISPSEFTCEDAGDKNITLTLIDVNGNESTCTTTVTITDNTDPVAVCQDFEVYLDPDGTVTIAPEDVDGGSSDNCGFELSLDRTEFDCDDLEGAESADFEVTLTVTDDSGNTDDCTATVTVKQRPTILTYTGDLEEQYSDMVTFKALLVDGVSNEPIEGVMVKFTIGTQWVSHITNADGISEVKMQLLQDPCAMEDWVVTAEYAGECPYLPSSDEVEFDYLPEDAEIEYTGTAISATKSTKSNDFTVTLRGIIEETDLYYPGDISNAKARFLVDGAPVSGWIPVIPLDQYNQTIGMIEYEWSGAITVNPTTYDIHIELDDCYYTGITNCYPLTVYNSVGDFITGGGHMIITENAEGIYAPSPDSKLNFGFNVKFNKRGTNLQGKMNIIYRELEDGEVVKVYQIKTTSTTSLGTNKTGTNEFIADFTSKATLTDVTNPEAPVGIMGNLTLHVTMTDRGEPGNMDMIGFALYDGSPSSLFMSSNWTGTKTAEQYIDGGNLVVHTSALLPSGSEPTEGSGPPAGKGKNKAAVIPGEIANSFEAYPNPFTDKIYFDFSRTEGSHARLELFDATGRMITLLLDRKIEPGETIRLEYVPQNVSTGMLFYRMRFDDEVLTGKLIYKR